MAVASQPSGQVAHAGKPLLDTAPGIGAPLASIVRPVLKGLYAAVLFVDPPSAACHASRSATSACVAGALTPWRMQSSQPGGSGVPPALWAGVAPPAVAVSGTHPARLRQWPARGRRFGGCVSWEVVGGPWLAGEWVVRYGTPRGGESNRGIQDWHVPSRVLLRVYRRPAPALESVVANMGVGAGSWGGEHAPRGGPVPTTSRICPCQRGGQRASRLRWATTAEGPVTFRRRSTSR